MVGDPVRFGACEKTGNCLGNQLLATFRQRRKFVGRIARALHHDSGQRTFPGG